MLYLFQWLEQSIYRPVTYINRSSIHGSYSFLYFLPVVSVQTETGGASEPVLLTLLLRATHLPAVLPCTLNRSCCLHNHTSLAIVIGPGLGHVTQV